MQSLRLSFSGAFALAALALFSFGCNSKPAGKQHVKFPFGNYNQQWVAVANIETPVE